MANTLTDVIPILYEALDIVSRELVGIIPSVSRDSSADRAAVNETVNSFIVPAVVLENITAGDLPADSGDTVLGNVTLTISKARAAPVRWTGEEQRGVRNSGQLNAIQRDRFVQSMRALTNEVEADLAGEYIRASRAYGTAGTTPFGTDLTEVAEIRKILADNGAPIDGNLHLVMDTSAGANLRSLTQVTDVNRAGSDDPLRRGALLDIHGFQLRESAGIKAHSAGSVTGTVTVTGAEAVGSTAIGVTTAAGASVSLAAGDVVTFGGSDKYVVATAVTIGASTTGNITIAEPGLRVALAGSETVAAIASFRANMAFHRSAIHLVTRAPAMPDGGDAADDVMEITDPVSGLAFQVALYRQYRRVKYEIGLAWGVKAVKPAHMALLLG